MRRCQALSVPWLKKMEARDQVKEEQQDVPTKHALNRLYDERMFNGMVDEYYSGSRFLNFGYWEDQVKSPKEASENLLAKLLSFIPQKTGTILDVACGTGATTRYLLNFYAPHQVTGINISAKQLDICRQMAPGCHFLEMDAVNLQFPDASFEAVVCVEAAFHFQTREKFLREVLRVLKPGGTLVLSDALISSVAKEQRPHFPEANFIEQLDDYRGLYRQLGFSEVVIEDATKQSWEASFWSVIQFAYGKFLIGAISAEQLYAFLDRIYRLTADLHHYVLVKAVKDS